MSLYAQEPQTVGKVLDNAFHLFKLSFKKVVMFSIIYSIIVTLPVLVIDLAIKSIEETSMTPYIVLGVVSVLLIIPALIFTNGMTYRMHTLAIEDDCGFSKALKTGLMKLLPVLVALIIYFLAVALGMILLIVPGFILMLSLFLYGVLIIVDDEKIIASLKKSHGLVWKNWWRTSLVLIVPVLVMMSISAVLGMIVLAGGFLAGGMTDLTFFESTAFIVLSNLINIPLYAVTMPLFMAVTLVQVHDLKLRKHGTDLEDRMAV